MRAQLFLLFPFLLTACAQAPSNASSRFEGGALGFAAQSPQTDQQAQALSELSRRFVLQTTLKGAGIGAAVGCGFVLVSANNAQNCVAAAAAGAVSGAVIGHVAGKQAVARKVETISPSAVVRTLRKTNDQMALVATSLPARLAAQEQVLADLDLKRASGVIDTQSYTFARTQIAEERRALAVALLETEENAAKAAANLSAAQESGQTGLDWHILNASKLAKEAHSSRSSISLL